MITPHHMNSPDEVLKIQRSLADASGSRKIALGLIIAGTALCVAQFIYDPSSRKDLLRTSGSWLSIVSLAAYMESNSRLKIHEIEAKLGDKNRSNQTLEPTPLSGTSSNY